MLRRAFVLSAPAALAAALAGCVSSSPVAPPGTALVQVRFVFVGPTARRTDLTSSQETCARFVGPTHLHPSWRNFESLTMNPVGSDRYELTLGEVPVGIRLSVQVADQNACVEDPAGWVTRNVLANDVALTQVIEAGGGKALAFTVAADGKVAP